MKKPDSVTSLVMLRKYFSLNATLEIIQNSQNIETLLPITKQGNANPAINILADLDKKRSYRQAAVLLLIYPGSDELEIILTRRSDHLSHHAGQISLPGGTVDSGDESHVYTALREAREEVGLNSQLVEILGALERSYTPSGFAITPIVGLVKERPELFANPDEVAQIVSIPLRLVLTLSCYQRDFLIKKGSRREFYIIEYEGLKIWGATAKILHSLACKLID